MKNPRVMLGISLLVLVVTFIGARLYVGQMLQAPRDRAPRVNVVDLQIPKTPVPQVAEPDPEPTAGELAAQEVEGAAFLFTTMAELRGEDRIQAAQAAQAAWQGLDQSTIDAVPEEARPELARVLSLVPDQIPDEPALAPFEKAYEAKRAAIVASWGL